MLLIFHASAWSMESEKIYKRPEVPSLVDQCLRCITSQADCTAQSLAHIAYALVHGEYTSSVKSKLEHHCAYIVNSAQAQQSYRYDSKSLDRSDASCARSHLELVAIIQVHVQIQRKPIEVIYTANEDLPILSTFLDFLHGAQASPGNTVITLPKAGMESSYLLISNDKHTLIKHSMTGRDIYYAPTQKGILSAEWQQSGKQASLTIHHSIITRDYKYHHFNYATSVGFDATNAKTSIIASPSGEHLHVLRQYSDGHYTINSGSTLRASRWHINEGYARDSIGCILPSLRQPEKAQRIFLGKRTCCTHNRAGSLYAYAWADGSIVVCAYPEGSKLFHVTIPPESGTPQALFFNASDTQLRCLSYTKNQVFIHQFDVPDLSDTSIISLLASYISPYACSLTPQPQSFVSSAKKTSFCKKLVTHFIHKLLGNKRTLKKGAE